MFFVSTRPHLQSPVRFPMWDKAAHLVEYALLGFLARSALRGSGVIPAGRFGGWRGLLPLGVGVGVALLDEWVQARVPGRQSSAADLAADALGLCAGVMAGIWAGRRVAALGRGEREVGHERREERPGM
jgi:VanZ family protein